MTPARRLRILSFTTLFPNPLEPSRGSFVRDRVAAVAAHADVTVVAPVNVGRRPRALALPGNRRDPAGFTVLHPRYAVLPGMLKGWDAAILYHESLAQVAGRIRASEFDIVESHYAYPDGAAARRLADRLRKPFALTVRGSDLEVLPLDPARRGPIRETLQLASAVIAVSDSLRLRAIELGASPQTVHVIPNGVDTKRFSVGDRNEARRRLGLPASERIVLAVGRLDPIKGLDLLLAAAAQLRVEVGPPVWFHLVGEGPMRVALERSIRKQRLGARVVLHGAAPPESLAAWYAAADVICLLSRSEGCPNVVLEALACGRPVVATRVGGIPELIRDSENGLLLSSRDPSEAAAAIETALRRTWDSHAIAGALRGSDWDRVARAQLDVYRSILRPDAGGASPATTDQEATA